MLGCRGLGTLAALWKKVDIPNGSIVCVRSNSLHGGVHSKGNPSLQLCRYLLADREPDVV